jgi:two-component system response regulator YesN
LFSVFLVEDEVVIREGIRELVAWADYGFEFAGEASDGELAWPTIHKPRPDLVITDIKMPFMDGLELARLIRSELPNTAVIVLTGHDDFDYARQALNIGVAQFLLKPLNKDQLIEALGEVKRRKAKESEQEGFRMQFEAESKEYLEYSRMGFFSALVSGGYSASELLERAGRLELDLSAQSFNVLLLTQENPGTPRLFEKAGWLCADEEGAIVFNAGLNMVAVLLKGPSDQIEALTEFCAGRLSGLTAQGAGVRIGVGEPVGRLSGMQRSYLVAYRELFGASGGWTPLDSSSVGGDDRAQLAQRIPWLGSALEHIEANFSDPDLSLRSVAGIAGVTPAHFSAVFSAQMGQTFVGFLTALRMDNARRLLRGSLSGISEIAGAVGYRDPHYFSYLFRKLNGISPSDYRSDG